jgi:hypothetical protein
MLYKDPPGLSGALELGALKGQRAGGREGREGREEAYPVDMDNTHFNPTHTQPAHTHPEFTEFTGTALTLMLTVQFHTIG